MRIIHHFGGLAQSFRELPVGDLGRTEVDLGERYVDRGQVPAQLIGGKDASIQRFEDSRGLLGLLAIQPGEDGRENTLFALVETGQDARLARLRGSSAGHCNKTVKRLYLSLSC